MHRLRHRTCPLHSRHHHRDHPWSRSKHRQDRLQGIFRLEHLLYSCSSPSPCCATLCIQTLLQSLTTNYLHRCIPFRKVVRCWCRPWLVTYSYFPKHQKYNQIHIQVILDRGAAPCFPYSSQSFQLSPRMLVQPLPGLYGL